MSKGIKLLDAVLFEIKDHGHPETKMQENILSWYIGLDRLTGHLSEAQLNMRRWDKPSERDRLELNRAPLEFSGDVEADSSGRMCPPLAWTTIWGGTYSNMYGWFTSDELRRWGYVFWDAARIKSTGVEALLEECWDYLWHGDDPRDDPSYWIGLPEEH